MTAALVVLLVFFMWRSVHRYRRAQEWRAVAMKGKAILMRLAQVPNDAPGVLEIEFSPEETGDTPWN